MYSFEIIINFQTPYSASFVQRLRRDVIHSLRTSDTWLDVMPILFSDSIVYVWNESSLATRMRRLTRIKDECSSGYCNTNQLYVLYVMGYMR